MAGEPAGEQRTGGELGGMCWLGRNLCPEPAVGVLMCKPSGSRAQ